MAPMTPPDPDTARPAGRAELVRLTSPDGVALALHVRGPQDAPTVVLLHGYPDDHSVWDPVAERLADHFRVVTPDVRGAGASDAPEDVDGYRLDRLLADLSVVIDWCGPQPVHLAAHDWGAIQAWHAVCDPAIAESVASFVSFSGVPLDHAARFLRRQLDPAPPWPAVLRQWIHSWYVGVFQVPGLPPFAWRTVLGRLWPRLLERNEGIARTREWPGPGLPSDGAVGVRLYRSNMMRRFRAARELYTDVPTRVVVLTEDAYVTPLLVQRLGAVARDVEFRHLRGGHWSVRSRPGEVADLIAGHAQGHQLGRRRAQPPRVDTSAPPAASEADARRQR